MSKGQYNLKPKAIQNEDLYGPSLAVQWLGLGTSTAAGEGLIPGRGSKIPHATWHGQKTKTKIEQNEDL